MGFLKRISVMPGKSSEKPCDAYVWSDLHSKNCGREARDATRVWIFAVLLLLWQPRPGSGQASEYELKAAFLYNFTQFISWPPQAFSSSGSSFQICILGKDPFGRTLDEIVQNEKVGDHPIHVIRIQDLTESEACHILFFPIETPRDTVQSLAPIREGYTLTVGDWPEFAEQGGVIAFRAVDRHIGLRVNLEAARLSNLTISSKLLRLSEVVE